MKATACGIFVAAVLSTAACGDSASDAGTYGGEPADSTIQDQPRAYTIPAELVGRWNGGSNETGHWYYEFNAAGQYRAWPAYVDNPQVIGGTAVVRPNTITLSNGGSPVTFQWSISGGILYLDGFSYVRA
jgi:hypothetical protein